MKRKEKGDKAGGLIVSHDCNEELKLRPKEVYDE